MRIYRNVVLTLLLLAAIFIAVEVRPRPAVVPAEPALSPDAERILDCRIPSLVLHHAGMRQAIDVIREATGVKISVDWGVLPKWDAASVDVDLKDVPLGDTLAYLFQTNRRYYNNTEQVDFDIVNQTVWITRSDLLSPLQMTSRIYNVHDLLTDEYWGCPSGADPAETQFRRLGVLADLLASTCGSRNWDMDESRGISHTVDEDFGHGDLQVYADRLIVLQTVRGHRQVQAALQRLRNGGIPPATRASPQG